MKEFLQIANSGVMYLMSSIVILSVVGVCLVFFTKAYKEGLKIGMNKKDLKKVVTSSAVFTVIPSVGILLGVITLSGSLGVPIPWLRLFLSLIELQRSRQLGNVRYTVSITPCV